jgi:hypothetical protein
MNLSGWPIAFSKNAMFTASGRPVCSWNRLTGAGFAASLADCRMPWRNLVGDTLEYVAA